MNVCLLTRDYPTKENLGRGINLYFVAHSLSKLDNKVIVVSQTRTAPFEWYDGKVKICEIGPCYQGYSFLSYLGYCYRLHHALARVLENEDIQVVEAPLFGALGLPYFLFSKAASSVVYIIRVITSSEDVIKLRSYPTFTSYIGFLILDKLEKMALRRANMIIVASRETKDKLIRQHGIPGQKIEVATLGVDTTFFTPDPNPKEHHGKFRIVFVGSLQKRKNLECLFYALGSLQHRMPNVEVVLAGPVVDPRYYQRLQALVRLSKIENGVTFLGAISNREKLSLLRSCDVFVSPSAKESFGDAVMEAMACGKPVIVTSGITGVNELVQNGKSGIIVPTCNVEALADAIWSLYTVPRDNREEMGAHAREHVMQNFSFHREAPKILRIYEKAINMIQNER